MKIEDLDVDCSMVVRSVQGLANQVRRALLAIEAQRLDADCSDEEREDATDRVEAQTEQIVKEYLSSATFAQYVDMKWNW